MMKFILPVLLMFSYSASFACDHEEGSAEMHGMSCNHEEGKTCDCMKKKGHGTHKTKTSSAKSKAPEEKATDKASEKPAEAGK